MIRIVTLYTIFAIPGALAASPNQGYYAGLSTLYPYKPVYCDKDPTKTLKTPCYGSPGDLVALPKSAPLPVGMKWCEFADIRARMVSKNMLDTWYQWNPRTVPADKQQYYGERLCYLEDRGKPKNINEFER